MAYIYTSADTLKKREFVKTVFDNNLYYKNGIYRTPTMLNPLSYNHLKMKQKGLLIYKKKRNFTRKSRYVEKMGFEPTTF